MFPWGELGPFALGNCVSIRNLGSIVQGNHVSLGEIHNYSSRMTILPSCMKAISDEDFHCKNM
jgi:hypothetical protein